MKSHDFKFEEFPVMEPIGRSFNGLDHVVPSFQGRKRYAVIVICQDSRLKGSRGFGKLYQYVDAGGFHSLASGCLPL